MKKRLLCALLVLALVVSLLPVTALGAAPTWDWSGYTPISNQAELEAIANDLDGKYYLTGDITLSGTWTPIGTESSPFTGVLDGNGKKIINLQISKTDSSTEAMVLGLFGWNSGVMRNLTIDGLTVDVYSLANSQNKLRNCIVGAFAGQNDGDILNCHVKTTATGGNYTVTAASNVTVGGICGVNNGMVAHCSNAKTINVYTQYGTYGTWRTNEVYIGGIAGTTYGYRAQIEFCTNSGAINAMGSTAGDGTGGYIGGIAGDAIESQVSNCRNSGPITAMQKDDIIPAQCVGGIVGASNYVISRCENTAVVSVYGRDIYAGGIVGDLGESIGGTTGAIILSQCRNDGPLKVYAREDSTYSCVSVGSIVGVANCAAIGYCYNDTATINAYTDSAKFDIFDGGFIAGSLYDCTMEQCYNPKFNTGVSSTTATTYRLGSLVGYATNSTLTACSYNSWAGTFKDIAGDGGGNYSDARSVAQESYFNQQRNYPNFNFTNIWTLSGTRAIFTKSLTHTHSLTKTSAVAGTCTLAGNIDYWHCTDAECDTYFRDSNGLYVIDQDDTKVAGGHTPGTPVEENRVEATCTTPGSYDEVVYCAGCKTYVISRTPKTIPVNNNHSYGVPEFQWADDYSSCKAVYTCAREDCDASYYKMCTISTEQIKGADCQTPGTITYTATWNGYSASKTAEGPVGDHNYGAPEFLWAEDYSSCKAVYTCDREDCDASYYKQCAISAERVKGSDCQTPGTVTYTATWGGYTDTRTVAGEYGLHTPGTPVEENRVEATCTAAGSYDEVIYCSVCKTYEISRTAKTIPNSGHSHGAPEFRWAEDYSTCTAVITCGNCGASEEHDCAVSGESITGADCKTAGTVTYTATWDTYSDTRTVAGAYGDHVPGEPVQEDYHASTCNSHGWYYEVIYCAVCKTHEISRQHKGLEKLDCTPGEPFPTEVVPSTCTKNGSCHMVTVCTVCKNVLNSVPQTLPLAEHTPGAPVEENRVEATCTESGSYDEVVYCAVCKTHEISRTQKAISVVPHTPGAPVEENRVEATCTESGSYDEVVYCTVCKTHEISRTQKTIPEVPHTPGEWFVTRQPTASRDGSKYQECAICHTTIATESIPKLGELPFTDVSKKSYCYDAVAWAYHNNITKGIGKTTFKPDDICNRAQTVTFLWRAMGSPEPTITGTNFTDVVHGSYYEKALLWAVEEGITSGTSATTFSPDMQVTRGQVVTFLWRCADKPGVSGNNPFTDVARSAFYYKAVLWAVSENITNGVGPDQFAPEDSCTRGQIVTFLYRYIN